MPASKIAVIETRLPYTDRRALSQAWFSALHLARETAPRAGPAPRSTMPEHAIDASAARNPGSEHAAQPTGRSPRVPATPTSGSRVARPVFDVPQRRATDVRTTAANRAHYAHARSYPPFRTSLTLEGADGTRVHLIVRRVGSTLHVVALCPPAIEEIVRRALASADLHFRARGESVRVDVNTGAAAT